MHVFKELGCTPAQKIFGFFDDWAIILSASVMLLLAGAAVWTIMDNRYARQLDRKDRLLNEIIEWARDVMADKYENEIRDFVEAVETGREKAIFRDPDEFISYLDKYDIGKNKLVTKRAEELNSELAVSVVTLCELLKKRATMRFQYFRQHDRQYSDERNRLDIYRMGLEVIERANKLV